MNPNYPHKKIDAHYAFKKKAPKNLEIALALFASLLFVNSISNDFLG